MAFQGETQGNYYVCGEPNCNAKYFRYNVIYHQNKNKRGANITEYDDFFVPVIEANLVNDLADSWVYSDATKHIYGNNSGFSTCYGSSYYVFVHRDTAATKVVSKRNHDHDAYFMKPSDTKGHMHVSKITKNLVFGFVLGKKGFKIVFNGDKFPLIKDDTFVGK